MTLPEYIAARLKVPFAWGDNDCVTFAIGWVQIATGKEYITEKWTNEKEAAQMIKKLGGIESQFDLHLNRINPNFAKDGDVALVDDTAYLFSGVHIVGPGKDGLIFKTRMEAKCAWSY